MKTLSQRVFRRLQIIELRFELKDFIFDVGGHIATLPG